MVHYRMFFMVVSIFKVKCISASYIKMVLNFLASTAFFEMFHGTFLNPRHNRHEICVWLRENLASESSHGNKS